MFFIKDEKVFSLSGTSDLLVRNDLTTLWGELFAYLLVAGFYLEGESDAEGSLHRSITRISDKNFGFTDAGYNYELGRTIAKGLSDRVWAIMSHPEINANEKDLLGDLDGLFSNGISTYSNISAKNILSVAKSRGLDDAYLTIAHYTAVTFGQKDFPSVTKLPRLYLSVFGNIHLSKNDTIEVGAPEYLFRSRCNGCGSEVTALWSFLSTQLNSILEYDEPGNVLVDMLTTFSFMSSNTDWSRSVPITRAASALWMQAVTGIEHNRVGPIAGRFYQQFLYGHVGDISISRIALFRCILDLMVKKMGESHQRPLFPHCSLYRKLADSSTIRGKESKRSPMLEYALEALDSDLEEPEATEDLPEELPVDDSSGDDDTDTETDPLLDSPEDTTQDPSVEDGGFDPSMPPIPSTGTVVAEDMDTIGLISFDKTGEGIDEDLYRNAVVALNDRLKSDDNDSVSADIKDALDYWVNGYLYLTAIAATKEQIASLGLQKFLKNI